MPKFVGPLSITDATREYKAGEPYQTDDPAIIKHLKALGFTEVSKPGRKPKLAEAYGNPNSEASEE